MIRKSELIEMPVSFFVWVDSKMGGAERRFLRLFIYLREQNYDVHLFTSAEGAEALGSLGLSRGGKRIHVLPGVERPTSRFSRYFSLIWRTSDLVKRIRKYKIRHIHFGGNPGVDTLLFAMVFKFACSFSASLVDPVKDYQQNVRKRMFTIIAARFCTSIDCLSEQIREDLCSFLRKSDGRKCLVSPCSFTDLKSVKFAKVRDIDICMVARMIPWKGHELLKNSLVELVHLNRSELVVHVCGSGPLESEIRQSFDLVENQSIHIHYEERPFEILARSKVFVSLQDIENYPSQSLLEAMICKCAIVATDVGSTRQLLDESCAILVPPDPRVLAIALERLISSNSLRDTLGEKAAERVASAQTIERFAQYFLVEVLGIEIAC